MIRRTPARRARGRLPLGGRPLALVWGVAAVLAARPARAQLPEGTPGWPVVLPGWEARRPEPAVVAENPGLAGLQGEGAPRWSPPGVSLRLGLDPVSLTDLADAPDPVPRALRERWLGGIESRGRERGDAAAAVRWAAVAGNGWAAEIASFAWTRARLDADAAELLLFGNSGRTGEPRALAPDGAVDAALLSSLTLALARRVPLPGTARAALGAAASVSVGHGVWVARDSGSLATAEPPTLALRFPMLRGPARAAAGWGAALHVGAAWEDGRWSAGLTVRNAVARLRWSRTGMTVRAGEAVIGPDAPDVDNRPRPVEDAPPALLAALERVRPAAELSLAGARRLGPRFRLAAELRTRARDGIGVGPARAATFAAEWRARSWLSVEGAGQLGDGLGVGIAAAPRLGGWAVRVAAGAGVAGSRREIGLSAGLTRDGPVR